jgi:hypothetical protein
MCRRNRVSARMTLILDHRRVSLSDWFAKVTNDQALIAQRCKL